MPLDLQRLARVRAHLLAATALIAPGCAGSSPPDTINEPVHINKPPDPPPDNTAKEPVHINTTPPALSATPLATPSATPSATPRPDPIHINRPNPNR